MKDEVLQVERIFEIGSMYLSPMPDMKVTCKVCGDVKISKLPDYKWLDEHGRYGTKHSILQRLRKWLSSTL